MERKIQNKLPPQTDLEKAKDGTYVKYRAALFNIVWPMTKLKYSSSRSCGHKCLIDFKDITGSNISKKVYISKLSEELREKYIAKLHAVIHPWTTLKVSNK